MFNDLQGCIEYSKIIDLIRSGTSTAAFGIHNGERVLLASQLGNVLYVTSDYVRAREIARELQSLNCDATYVAYKDDVLTYRTNINNDSVCDRNLALYKLLYGGGCAVVCVESLLQLLPDVNMFKARSMTLSRGDVITRDKLIKSLNDCNYLRVEVVSVKGEYAVRGDIIDVFTPYNDSPVRIDMWDDIVERINYISLQTYTSVEECDSLAIFPLCDTLVDVSDKQKLIGKLDDTSFAGLQSNAATRLNTILQQLKTGVENNDMTNNYLLPYVTNSRLWDYLRDDTVVVYDEPREIGDRINRLYNEHYARVATLMEAGEITKIHILQLVPQQDSFVGASRFTQLAMQMLPATMPFFNAREIVNLTTSNVNTYRQDLTQLCIDIKLWLLNGYKIAICSGSDEAAQRLKQRLDIENTYLPVMDDFTENDMAIISTVGINEGFISHVNKLVVIGVKEVFNKQPTKKLSKNKSTIFLAPQVGDYVVHAIHGVGVCQGITSIANSEGLKDYIVVGYKGNDTLYVPVENSNLLSKYSGQAQPKLNKIGGAEFEKVKSKVKAQLKEMAIDLLKLYAQRSNAKREFKYFNDKYLMDAFAANFPYEETVDQQECINQVLDNMDKPDGIMDRLLVGDVGFGKTEVAMRAAFKAVMSGVQVAFLSPTTILSQQHYETLTKRFAPFNVKVRCLNRFRTASEVKDTLKGLADGSIDIVVGTHRLLSGDITFSKLGLLILDEEQRFGVEDKEKIKLLKNNVDVLAMSATPIPRTLHMSLTGIRDISIIATPPKNRQSIQSMVVEDSDALIKDIILRELGRDGQVFIVYNRVETIERFASKIAELCPAAKIIIAHGQMKGDMLEDNIFDFANGKYNVLVCTMIIENGIDIPNANTLIVYDADNLGLSQLYQLRGRVGRSDRLAYAYFVYPPNKILSPQAYKRLTSIMQYTELGSGFKIALKDLEIRGCGDILGREQHGHMIKVGYDMYAKLLNEAVEEIKGVASDSFETVMEVNVAASVPQEYIEDSESRMDFYSKLASLSELEQVRQLMAELTDIYGTPPQSVVNLLLVAQVKIMANKVGVDLVTVNDTTTSLRLAKPKYLDKKMIESISKLRDEITLNASNDVTLIFNNIIDNNLRKLKYVGNYLMTLLNCRQ